MENKINPNKSAMLQHIQFLFSKIGDYKDGKIEIAYTPSNTGAVNKAEYFDVTELEAAAEFAYNKNKENGVNVYIGAALRDPDTAPFGRSNANDFYASTCLWVDLDDADAARTAKDKYSDLPPSMIVVTGRTPNLRAQCWWHIMHPEVNKDALNDNLAFICAALNGDRAVVDPARVMRLGGSIAWPKKEGRVPELTEIIIPNNNTKVVMLDHFKSYFPNAAPPLLTATKAQAFGKVGRNAITNTINIPALLDQSRNEGQWHISMRDAIAAMVSRGWSDEQIRITTNSYRRDRSLVDDMITPLIESARRKWDIPEPQAEEYYDEETGEIIKAPKNKMHLISASDFSFNPDANDIVRDIFTAGGLSVVYGESNCGKTFFITDLCFSISENKEWRGKRVEGGAAVYVPLEGVKGISSRIYAYKKENDTQLNDFYVMPTNFSFLDEGQDTEEFINLLKSSQVQGVKIVVIDTLARAVGGGDENSGQDMGLLVRHADRIREHTGAHVCFVHHSGKDKAKGARGHSSLRAAVDTEIEISREEGQNSSVIKIVKQRDMEMIEPMAFTLKRVVLGQNKYGEDVSSCVVEHEDYKETARVKRLTPIQEFIYNAIVSAILDCGVYKTPHKDMPKVKCITYEDLHTSLEARGYKEFLETEKKTTATQVKNTTTNARIALQKMNKISFYGNYIWLLDQDG